MITKAQKRKGAKSAKAIAAFGLCTALLTSMGVGTLASASAYRENMPKDGKYYTDYNTLAEAQEAGADLTADIAAEGQTLLKNSHKALPMAGSERVSVFGVAQDALAGNSASDIKLLDALSQEGFKVNPALRSYYETVGTTFGSEVTEFDNGLKNSFGTYRDAAIVVLSRGGGEGSDMSTVTDEEADDANENDGWTHANYVNQADGKKHKHFLQMTDSEYELYEYVKAQGFKKIIYLINSSEIFEIKNLADDNDVDGILWIGRPGAKGTLATARILNGKINPSGKTVDTWYSDFTADPTWFNAINNKQVGSAIFYSYEGQNRTELEATLGGGGFGGNSNTWNGVDYEEDIYLGYRYYETKAFDLGESAGLQWYDNAVVYPFGYGLSYTSFKYSNMGVKLGNENLGSSLDASKISSSVGHEAQEKTLTVSVDITNDGSVAGKETVQIYLNAPYFTGEVEKPVVKLVGFGKTDILNPGETQTVSISVNVQDLASYDYTDANGNGYKGYELDEGDYVLMALPNAHGWATSAGVMHPFALTNGTTDTEHTEGRKAAYLELDDFSGNKIENLFSKENGIFYSLRDNTGANKFNADPTANQVLMSRSNGFVLPAAPTVADLTMSLNMYKSLLYWDNFSVDNLVPDTVIAGNSEATTPVYYKDGQTIEGVVSPADFPWMVETAANSEAMKNWNQTGEYKYADGTTVKLSDMTGIDPYSTEKVGGTGRFKDKTGVQAWEEFMNSLSWQDLMDLVGKLQKQALPAISMNSMADGEFAFSPAGMCNFTCTCILAATWNTELANLKGTIAADMMILSGRNTGWGTSANTHRSPFAGRVFEYTSEDGILGGYISSAETLGANSRGLATYTKHCALNDQETSRNGRNLFAWVSEQAMREIYYKSFQMVAQEGQSAGIMGAFARAGRVSINVNYNFVTKLFREEWGCKTVSVTTDAYAGMRSCSPLDMLVRAGTDTIATNTMSGTWDATDKTVTVKNGDAVTGANQYYTTRKCAMIFLWTHANTAMNKNGVSFNWAEAELNATQGTAVAAGVKVNSGATGDKVEYVVSNGALPAGLTLNADGTISGTPTAKAGEYKFTVECRIDNWVKNTKQYTYTVASGFVIDENEASVGEEFFGEISSETVTTQKYNDGIVYSVKEGVLPAGLSLDANGVISGTPAEAGEFTVVINVAASRSERQGWTSIKVTDNYEYEVTLTVEGDEPVADHGGIVSSAINDKGELEITYADGTVDNLGVVVGKDGADGVNGTNGKDGVDGKDAEGGCSGSVAATVVPVTVALVLAGVAVIVFRKKNANK